jgi:branched-chain amino acid transport system permease protein
MFIQFLTGLAGASSLFLVAAGLTVIFGVTRVVNFSHGSLFMLGAYIAWSILTRLPREPAWHAGGVVAAAVATAGIGALIEMLLLRRLYRSPELLQLLATFGVVLIVRDLVLLAWGPADLPLPRAPWLRGFAVIAGARFPLYDLVLIGAGPVVLAALWAMFRRTRWGTIVRAATEDRDMVGALGVDERLLFTATFALGAGLAGLGGALALPDGSANLQMDLPVVIDAFVVVVVGGLGSLPGAYLAALLLGLLQSFGVVLLPRASLVVAFVAMAAVLTFRPHGLLGRPQAPARGEAESHLPIRPAGWRLRAAGLVAVAAAVAVPWVAGPFGLSVATEALVAMLFAASLHVMMGPGGMPSFGHAAWFGIGAYAAALAARGLMLPMPAGLALGLVAAGAAALALGWFVVRLSGVALAMLTLAFAQIVWAAATQSTLTGGDDGVLGVWPDVWARDAAAFYWLALAVCGGGALALRRVMFSPFGYALRGVRDSPARAEAIGLDARSLRVSAFALAGAAAGLAGALAAYSKGSVFPTMVAIDRSVDALVMVLLGGVETVSGPIVGALAYTGLYDALLRATDYWRLVLGVAIIVLVVAFPQGIAGAARREAAR